MKMPPEQNITPDRWVVIEITHDDKTFRKILSAFSGRGMFDSGYWRLSSPVVEETEMKQHIEFATESGSTYKCLRAGEGLTGLTSNWLSNFQEQSKDRDDITVKVLCYGDQT